MGILEDDIEINGSIENTFNFATTPSFWPDYHPLSVNVEPAMEYSPELGTEFYEVVNVLFIKQKFLWKVVKKTDPSLFEISGFVKGFFGGKALITYTLTEKENKTVFHRQFTFERNNPLLKILDWLIIDKLAIYDGRQALLGIKKHVEQGA